MKKALLALAATAILFAGVYFTEKHVAKIEAQKAVEGIQTSTPQFGATFTPVEGTSFTIASTVLPAATTIKLSSFKTPDGRVLIMSYFGSKGYGTLDPTNNARLESISWTGITQNGDGTAVLTGVSRGLDFVTPYAASTTLATTHLVGSQFILSNTSAFYGNEFAFVNNPSTILANWTFGSTTPPRYDVVPTFGASSGTWLVPYSTLLATAIQGAGTSTETSMGISQLSTYAEVAAGTASSTSGAPKVIPTRVATSTPYSGSPAGIIPTTGAVGGKLSQLFLDLTQAFTFSGLNTFTAGWLTTASSTNTATTTLAASSVTNKALVLNAIPYAFPPAITASSTALETDASGNLHWVTTQSGAVSTSTSFATGSLSQGTSISKTVFCVSPKVVSGGGYAGFTASSNGIFYALESYPASASSWTVTAACSTDGGQSATCSGTITVYALCVNP